MVGGYTQYIYDAEGHRTAKLSASSLVCAGTAVPATGSVRAKFLLGQSGEQVTELDGSDIWQHTNVFAAGSLLATYVGSSVSFRIADPLGTTRIEVATTATGGSVVQQCQSLPYGDGQLCSAPAPTEHFFTGKERDAESGLDNFGARYYSSSMGRFMSPDPSGLMYANAANPQSLNLYSYALNNPLRMIDPTGLTSCFYGGAGDTPQNDNDASDYEDTGTDQNCHDNGGTVLSENATVNVNADYSGSITVTADGGGSSSLIQQINICRGQGNGPSLTNFQAAGAAVADSLTNKDLLQNAVGMKQNLSNLYNLRSGGTLDSQAPNGGPGPDTTPYANYGYGMYMGSAAYSLRQTLNGANAYAGTPRALYGNGQLLPGKYGNQPPDFFDPTYTNTPAANVPNIVAGYQAAIAGNTSCPTN